MPSSAGKNGKVAPDKGKENGKDGGKNGATPPPAGEENLKGEKRSGLGKLFYDYVFPGKLFACLKPR